MLLRVGTRKEAITQLCCGCLPPVVYAPLADDGTLFSSQVFSGPLNAEPEVTQLVLLPDGAIRADTALPLRILRVLPARTKEPVIEVILIIGRAFAVIADAPLVIILVIRNVHFWFTTLFCVSPLACA